MGKAKIALISLGCDKNLVESERILGALGGGSYDFSPAEEDADIVIINTCGFIKEAEDEAKEHISCALELKERGVSVIVTGCLAQRYGDKLHAEFPGIDALVTETEKLPAEIEKITGVAAIPKGARVLSTPPHYAYLKIAEGCDNACAYCTIPNIKGRLRSRPVWELAAEAETLAAGGVKELIIIAQDCTAYGMDLAGKPEIVNLLQKLSEIGGIERLRLMYCYPERITDELIKEIADNPKICKYLDMPIQHSDGNVLARMGRGMDGDGLRKLIGRLRATVPGIVLRTTVMTGFPGESKEEFRNLLNFLNEVQFERLGAFAYSRESGTAACDMPGQLDEKVKQTRRDRVMEQQSRISSEKLRKFAGKTLRVLVDGWDGIAGLYFGRSYMDCPEVDGLIYIKAKYGELSPGSFVEAEIYETDEYDMYGKVRI